MNTQNTNNTTTQNYNLTVAQLKALLTAEVKYQRNRQCNGDRNACKQIAKCQRLMAMLNGLRDSILFCNLDGVRGNADRPHNMVNAGSVAEVCLTAYLDKQQRNKYSKSLGLYDGKQGAVNYQVKASLASSCLATPSYDMEFTYIVNTQGVYRLSTANLPQALDKNGRAMYKGIPQQYLVKTLTTAMGYDM